MARPLSLQKRENLLKATTELVAKEGTGVATARIAQTAGEPVGTLFRYFETKEVLMSQLFLRIKDELHEAMVTAYRETSDPKENAEQMWNSYISWGARFPEKRCALLQLDVSDLVSADCKARGASQFADVFRVFYRNEAREAKMAEFAAAIFASLATATITFMADNPESASVYRNLGFASLWDALARINAPA